MVDLAGVGLLRLGRLAASVGRDVRYAVRTFTASPGFALAAVLSLALGIGANTSLFTVINAVMLRPLPYRDAERLVILWNRSPGLNITEDWFSTAQYFDIKAGHGGFEELALALGAQPNLTGGSEPERVTAMRVSANLLPMFGAGAELGRLFLPEEDLPGRPPTAILTYGMWARRFGSDPRILGRSVILNGQSFQIVGVLPQSFAIPREVVPLLYGGDQADLFLPLPLAPAAATIRDHEDYNIVGKLKPGLSLSQAQAEMDTITARLRRDHPEVYPPNGGLTFSIVPLFEQVVGDVRRPLYLLLGSVGFVLLAVCANVANLLLARSAARTREMAIRTALGAGRRRIVAQLLTESLLLAFAGGGAGTLLSLWTVGWIHDLGTKSIPRLPGLAVDGRVLGFTFAVSAVTGVLFGLVPALRISGIDLASALKEGGRVSGGLHSLWGRGRGLRRALVIAELAISVTLLIGAGLLLRSFMGLLSVHPGFAVRNVLTFGLTMSGRQYGDAQLVLSSYRRLKEKLESMPGIAAAGATSALPLSQAFSWTPITIEGRVPPPGEKFINTDERVIAGRYFETMEIPLIRGRFFDERDMAEKPRVVIVDENMASAYWPGQDPVGKRIRHGGTDSTSPWMTVVGVVGRVKHETLDSEPRIACYLPHTQYPVRAMTVVVRTVADPAASASNVKEGVRAIDPGLPMYQVRTMEDYLRASLARRRFSTSLLAAFAAVALALAAVGVYGVIACLVDQGTREIGIRIALGATRGRILAMVLGQAVILAAAGVGIGIAAAAALTGVMKSMLFGVSATDPLTFVTVPAVLLAVALLACYIPARRASVVDPMSALRSE
jgi:predicted permease